MLLYVYVFAPIFDRSATKARINCERLNSRLTHQDVGPNPGGDA
jgi:hypothetical protein